MNCDASHELLQQRLDGTPVESAEWIAHLRGCADCQALEAATRRLEAGLRLLASPLPPPDLAARIADRVLRDRRRARRRWAVSMALAAGLFVALALRLDWRGTPVAPHADKQPPIAERKTPGTKEAPPPADPPTLRESATEAGAAVASLTRHTADETMESTRRLVPSVSSPSLPRVDLESIEPPTRPLREAGEGVSAGLEPVANSARRAVDLFLRDLPPMDVGQKGL